MMQARRSPIVAPLALAHPPMLRRRSSVLSNNAPSLPRTPTCGSPIPFLLSNNINNRKSSDSWNSWEEADELEWEWKQEHILLLSRTLDALPAHLLTPFNGMPPSNLLDKIARGVTQAKGPEEWPHAVRATRVKLLELSRLRAKEAAQEERRRSIIDEEGSDRENVRPTNATGPPQRPLYRQSSMDFMRNANLGPKNNENIGRLSSRLQRADKIIHHPYSRPSERAESPLVEGRRLPSTLNPCTPSRTTLNSATSTVASRIPVRRSSTLTISSDMSVDSYTGAPLLDPRVQRIRHSGSFSSMSAKSETSSIPRPRVLKRAPSYGASSNNSSSESTKIDVDGFVRQRKDSNGSTASSDEEEKERTKNAKKARRKSPTVPPAVLPCSPSPKKPKSSAAKKKIELGPLLGKPMLPPKPLEETVTSPRRPSHRPRANLQRNPSIIGPELPHLIAASVTASVPYSACPSSFRGQTPGGASLLPAHSPPSPMVTRPSKRERASAVVSPPAETPPMSPGSPTSQRRLRRVKGTTISPLPRLAPAGPARRISFGSLVAPSEEGSSGPSAAALALGSAFQLH